MREYVIEFYLIYFPVSIGGFHPKDINRINTMDIWLQRFLEHNELDMKKSLKQLWDTCEWRQTYGTNGTCDLKKSKNVFLIPK